VPQGWKCLYDLRLDTEHIAQVQKVSRETKDFGFPTKPALFGSRKWWRMVEAGDFPTETLDGEIIDVYWGSMADYPEFRIRVGDGTEHDLTREGDLRRYVPGLGASVRRVALEGKPSMFAEVLGPTRKVVLSIVVEDTDERSPAVAPGPGGAGYQHSGGPGTRVVYFETQSARDAEAIAALAEPVGGRGRSWSSVMGGAWAAVYLPPEFDDLVGIRSAAETRHGRYDGYEVVPAKDGAPVAYGPLGG
jgi:hypothetical protein